MTTLLHLYTNTDATELTNTFKGLHFKLSDWIGVINWTHLLQSERNAQYYDSFVCSRVFKVKTELLDISDILFNIKCFLYDFHKFVFSGKKPNQFEF